MRSVSSVVRGVAGVGAGLWIAAAAVVVAMRLGYPLDLEWMEGGSLHHALRIQQGLPLYAEPSADFVPFLYTPLYPAVLAALGWVFPLGYPLGRIVSVLAWVAAGAALWRAVRGEGAPRSHALAAVGLFVSGYVFTFRWLDVARADTLFLALLAWGLVLLRHARGDPRRAAWAGLLVALAFWTKQTAGPFVVVSGLVGLAVARRRVFTYAAVIAVVDGGGVLLGQALTDGWLWTYIYELHQTHAFNRERFTTKTWGMFAHAAPFLVVALPWIIREQWRRFGRNGEPRDDGGASAPGVLFWGALAGAGLLTSALGYSTQWAEPNAFVPGVFFTALFLGVVLPRRGHGQTVVLGLIAAQLLFALAVEPRYQPIQDKGLAGLGRSYRWQDPARTVPNGEHWSAARAMRARLEATQGEVFALQHPWWSVVAGGGGHVGSMGINDVPKPDAKRLKSEIGKRIESVRFEQVITEGEPPAWLRGPLARGYRLEARLRGRDRARPMTGYMSDAGMVTRYRTPQLIFAAQQDQTPPPGGRVLADFEDGTLQGFEVRGSAFGRRPQRGIAGTTPAVGPHGGAWLLSSAGTRKSLDRTGVAESPVYQLPTGGDVQLWVGTSGRATRLRVEIVEVLGDSNATNDPAVNGAAGGPGRLAFELPATAYTLSPVRLTIPPDFGRSGLRIRIIDDDPRAAIFADDLWWIPTS